MIRHTCYCRCFYGTYNIQNIYKVWLYIVLNDDDNDDEDWLH